MTSVVKLGRWFRSGGSGGPRSESHTKNSEKSPFGCVHPPQKKKNESHDTKKTTGRVLNLVFFYVVCM